MTEDQATLIAPFSCRNVTVHFIYSFAYSREGEQLPDWTSGTPHPERGVIFPHLALKQEGAAWKRAREIDAVVQNSEISIRTSLGALIRVFPTGGTCTLKVQTKDDPQRRFKPKDVLALLNMVKQRFDSSPDSILRVDGDEESCNLYSRFLRSLGESSAPSITWLDRKHQLVDTDSESQSPWVVTVAEVDGDVASAFCGGADAGDDPARSKMLRLRRYEEDIAPILFRSVTDTLFLEPAYVQPPTSVGVPGLFSVNLDARLFVSMSRRAILCICRDAKQDPAAYFIPGLLDICELVRARWHALIILNKLLDLTIRDIASRKGTRQMRQTNLMERRQALATCLEDPTLYIVAGDALSKLYSDLRDIFRLEDLKSTLLAKMDLADKVLSDAQELDWMEKRGLGDS
jgi:hypothetical protein